MKNTIKVFNQQGIRSEWNDEQEKWYFAIVDVISVLTDSTNPQVYWRVLKKRLINEGNETVTNCNAFKMQAPDGKMRLTDVADTEQMFRLIQSSRLPKPNHLNCGSHRLAESAWTNLKIRNWASIVQCRATCARVIPKNGLTNA